MLTKKRLAQAGITIGGTPVQTPGGISHLTPDKAGPFGQNLLQLSVTLMLIAAIVLSMIFLVWGGIRWILSGGDPKAIEGARAQIMYAIIGLIIAFSSYFIIGVVGHLFNVELLYTPPLPPGAST